MNGILEDLKNAFRKKNNALMQIIVINILVFVVFNILFFVSMWLFKLEPYYHLIYNQVFTLPAALSNLIYRPWTLITYFFAHGDFFHIFFNMLTFYWFGQIIAEYLGSKRVISLYVLGGLVGGLSYIAVYHLIPRFQPLVEASMMLGASASVYAVVVAAATLMPNYVFFLFLFGPVRIKYIALVLVLLSFMEWTGGNPGGNIAHVGGALMGYIFILQLKRGNDLGAWIHDVLRIFRRKPKMKTTYVNKTKVTANTAYNTNNGRATGVEIPDQDEIDAILDKISASGYESLSKEEKQKLFRASKNN